MSSLIAPVRSSRIATDSDSRPQWHIRPLSRTWNRILSRTVLLLLLQAGMVSAAWSSDTSAGQPSDPLFRFAAQKQVGDKSELGDAFQFGDAFQPGDAVAIQPDLELLASSLHEGRELLLPSLLGDDDRYRIVDVREFVDGIISVRAVHAESPYDQLSFSFDKGNGLVLGSVNHHTRGQAFRILPPEVSYQKTAPEASGYHRFTYADPEKEDILPCGVDHSLSENEALHTHHHDPLSQSHVHSAFDIQSSGLEGSVPIDLMIVYTLKAAQWATSNAGNISLLIGEMMNISQTALDNSHANIDLRVVHTYFTLYEETTDDSRTDLYRLAASTSFNPWGSEYQGYMEEVHTLRDQHGADLVSMLTTNSDAGGLAFMPTNPSGTPQLGFSVNRVQQMASTTTFVHEIGHNLGKAHSRNQKDKFAGAFGGMFDYSTGWRFTGDSGTSYATVMTYTEAIDQTNSSRISYFSNPDVTFDGVATGTYSGQFAPADNVRSMQYTRNVVSSYRPTEVDPPLASMDNSPIEVVANYGGMKQVQVTLSNDGDSPLYWTADVRYPDPPAPAKIALSEARGMVFEGSGRPVIAASYPLFNAQGNRLIRYPDRAEYSTAPAASAFSSSYTKNTDSYSMSTDFHGGFFVTEGNSSGVPDNLVYQTDFDFIPGSEQATVEFRASNEWTAWPRNESAAFVLSNVDANSEPRNLRLTPRTGLESGRLTGVVAPFFGPLTSQGYSISMDLKLPSLNTQNQFHILVEEPSRDNLTAWLWFDDGKIIIRNQITPGGRDFFDSGVNYTPNEYFHFEIRTDPLNGRIYYLIDGNEIFDGNLYEGSAPERILLAHTNHQTADVFEIDNFHISTRNTRDFPRFQFRKESGGIAAGSSATITFDVIADRSDIGVYEFDMVVNTNDAANPAITVPVRYTVTDDPVSAQEEQVAGEFRLNQNYPNPFNPSTTITYAIPDQTDVRLEVYNINGQRVAVLVDEVQQAGEHRVPFDARGLASGVYLYRLQAGSFTKTERMVLLK